MSAQDVVSDADMVKLSDAVYDRLSGHFGDFTGTNAGWAVDAALEALAASGYALVKLPEQMADSDGGLSDVATFDGANTIYYAIDGRVEDDSLNRWQNLDDARGDAAALLAAAARAEEAQS